MTKREVIAIEKNGKISEHVYYSKEETSKLVLFFPGSSSNTTIPIFYYLRDYFIRNGYDVLSLSYKGLVVMGETYDEQMKELTEGTYQAIEHVKGLKSYQKVLLAANGLGNVVSSIVRSDFTLDLAKSIYISPPANALEMMKKNPGLIITSKHDAYLEEEHIEEILSDPNHEVLIFNDGDEMLECNDTLKTIDFCKSTISKVIEFVKEK